MFHFPTMHPEAIYLLPFPKNYYAEDYVGYQQTFSALSVPKTGTLAAASLPTSHISWDPIDQSLLTSLSQLFAISKLQTQAFVLSQLPTRKSDGLPAYFIQCLCSPRLDSTPWSPQNQWNRSSAVSSLLPAPVSCGSQDHPLLTSLLHLSPCLSLQQQRVRSLNTLAKQVSKAGNTQRLHSEIPERKQKPGSNHIPNKVKPRI